MLGDVARTAIASQALDAAGLLVTVGIVWARRHTLDVLGLGRAAAIGLGVDHRREVTLMLALISTMVAISTALVGPLTFFGFLVATLAYQFADTYDHKYIFPIAVLLGFTVLAGAYFIMRHVFYAYGIVSIIIELIGGSVFLIVILRKGRL